MKKKCFNIDFDFLEEHFNDIQFNVLSEIYVHHYINWRNIRARINNGMYLPSANELLLRCKSQQINNINNVERKHYLIYFLIKAFMHTVIANLATVPSRLL